MAIHHSIEEILTIMEKDLKFSEDLNSKKVDKMIGEAKLDSVKTSMQKLKDLEKWLSIDHDNKKREAYNIKNEIHNEKIISKKNQNTDFSYYKSYKHSNSRSQKYGSGRDSTIFNNQIFRLLMDSLIEDKKIYNIILKDSPLFPNEEIEKNPFLNQHEGSYLIVTDEKTEELLGNFNFTACRMWFEHVGTESSYKKYPNTYMKIIKKSKTHYKIIFSRTRPLLEVREDKVIKHCKENKL